MGGQLSLWDVASEFLYQHYRNPVYRIMRTTAFNGRKRADDNFIARFRRDFGNNALVCIGDYSRKGATSVKFHAPAALSHCVKMFQKAGYTVRFVNEFCTSLNCSQCRMTADDVVASAAAGGYACCEPFLHVRSPRPFRSSVNKCHGLVKCGRCSTVYNRDHNSAINILYCAVEKWYLGTRPRHLQSSSRSS
jgi:hypothetical protein